MNVRRARRKFNFAFNIKLFILSLQAQNFNHFKFPKFLKKHLSKLPVMKNSPFILSIFVKCRRERENMTVVRKMLKNFLFPLPRNWHGGWKKDGAWVKISTSSLLANTRSLSGMIKNMENCFYIRTVSMYLSYKNYFSATAAAAAFPSSISDEKK